MARMIKEIGKREEEKGRNTAAQKIIHILS
jgi:hypothetical protein